MAWLDTAGCIVAVNDGWARYCRENGGDLATCGVGSSYLEVCEAAGDAASHAVGRAIREAIDGRAALPVTTTVPCHGPQRVRWFELTVFPRADDAGSPVGAAVALRLVAEGPGGAASVLERADDLGSSAWDLIEAAPDGLVVIDGAGTIRYVNRQLERLTGHDRNDLLGADLGLLVPDAVRSRHGALVAGYAGAPRPRMMGEGVDLAVRRADGSELAVEISLAPVLVGEVAMTAASVRDVTDQRAADRARQELLRILDLDPDAVFVIDPETTAIEYANSGAEALLGYRRDELLDLELLALSPYVDDERLETVLGEFHRAGPEHQHDVEVVRRAADGTDIPCDSRSQLVAGADGRERFLVVDRDARPRLEAERHRSRHGSLATLMADLTAQVLQERSSGDVYRQVVEGAAALLDAENASLLLRSPDGRFVTQAAVGPAATLHLDGTVRMPQATFATWEGLGAAFAVPAPPPTMPSAIRELVGPGVVALLHAGPAHAGFLTTFRAVGRAPFDETDIQILDELARQVATVVALGDARRAQGELAVLEDRNRIARDLHDTIIQDLIAVGMQLAGGPGQAGDWRDPLLDQLERTVRNLRAITFDTRHPALDRPGVEESVEAIVLEAARALGHLPTLTIHGPLDTVDRSVAQHLLPSLREALSNVARHADAPSSSVTVSVDSDRVTLVVADDGRGPGDGDRGGTGLSNLAERAALLGGSADLLPRAAGGTELRWTAMLDQGDDQAASGPMTERMSPSGSSAPVSSRKGG